MALDVANQRSNRNYRIGRYLLLGAALAGSALLANFVMHTAQEQQMKDYTTSKVAAAEFQRAKPTPDKNSKEPKHPLDKKCNPTGCIGSGAEHAKPFGE